MINEEPISIFNFISRHFDVINELYTVQKNERIIQKEIFEKICIKYNADGIKKTLFRYKIIKPVQEDFELRDVYYNVIEYILVEFRPMLPDEIEKYGQSISDLFMKIKEGVYGDKLILSDRIVALSEEIKKFSEAVEKNKIRLLAETRELKANVKRIDYSEKIQKASHWTGYYILPMNRILDVNYSESITNKLFNVSEFVNQKRLNFEDEGLRSMFERLHKQLIHTIDDTRANHKTFINELLPFIERIKTESLILTGWINFLKKPYKTPTPKLFKNERNNPISDKMFLNTKEYFEMFQTTEDVYIDEDLDPTPRWMFNKTLYKTKLQVSLPVNDFFKWCNTEIEHEGELTNEKFLSLMTLLFDESIQINADAKADKTVITTVNSKFIVPKLKVTKNGI